MFRKQGYTIAFISWMVFVTWSSLASFSHGTLPRIKIPQLDKLVHFIFYFIAVVLAVMFVQEQFKGKVKFIRVIVICVLSMISFGIIIEVIQYAFTVNRSGDIFDVLANSVGTICGAVSIKYVFSRKALMN